MSDKPIEVGDRVEVIAVDGFCDCDNGKQGIVDSVQPLSTWHCLHCQQCGHITVAKYWHAHLVPHEIAGWKPVERLKKLPPLVDELQETFEQGLELLKAAELTRQ